MERQTRPKNSETFWKGMQVDLGEGRTLSASVWPKVCASHCDCSSCHTLLLAVHVGTFTTCTLVHARGSQDCMWYR